MEGGDEKRPVTRAQIAAAEEAARQAELTRQAGTASPQPERLPLPEIIWPNLLPTRTTTRPPTGLEVEILGRVVINRSKNRLLKGGRRCLGMTKQDNLVMLSRKPIQLRSTEPPGYHSRPLVMSMTNRGNVTKPRR